MNYTDSHTTRYTVADYLLDRLAELDVDTVFGVPGDFTLGFLDHVDERSDMRWVGTANELGAGYAADGYARMRGFGVVSTTFGVGELSAVNAIAGSYAEFVPVLHIVGSPTEFVQSSGRPTHHSLGDGDFDHMVRMSAEVTVAQAVLTPDTAAAEIDRVLSEMIVTSRPGYLSLPADVAEAICVRPSGSLAVRSMCTDPNALRPFAAAARRLLDDHSPVVLADIFVHRSGAQEALDRLIKVGGLQYSSLLWGRRVVDESAPGYLGIYVGEASRPEVRRAVENAPVLITAGVSFTDLVSGYFSQHLDANARIDLQPHTAVVAGEVFDRVEMHDALETLAELVVAAEPVGGQSMCAHRRIRDQSKGGALTQEALWHGVAAAVTSSDIVLAEQGTSFYGLASERLPHGVHGSTALGLDRLYAARAARCRPGRARTSTGPPHRRRRGADDRRRVGHSDPQRRARGHRCRQQQRIHGGAGDPRTDQALQRHRAVGVDATSLRARRDQWSRHHRVRHDTG